MVHTSYQVRMNRYLDPEFALLTSSKYEASICSAYKKWSVFCGTNSLLTDVQEAMS
jgi:hypothetical protein